MSDDIPVDGTDEDDAEDDVFLKPIEDEEEAPANRVAVGDDINIIQMDPTLKDIKIAVGWDSNAFGSDIVDVDISLFLLDHKNMTRVNEDFVFYNNTSTLDGAVQHAGDNRTGAGQGDDETILIDLHGIPFDVSRIVFVYSIYKGAERDQGLGLIRESYIRLINSSNEHEMLRFDLDEHFDKSPSSAAIVGSLNREGPKWHFTPLMDVVPGGLAEIATQYGMTVIQQ